MWLAYSTPRIYYHSLRRIQAPVRCAGYDRHQTRSILVCTVGKRIYAKSYLRGCDLWTSEALDAPSDRPCVGDYLVLATLLVMI